MSMALARDMRVAAAATWVVAAGTLAAITATASAARAEGLSLGVGASTSSADASATGAPPSGESAAGAPAPSPAEDTPAADAPSERPRDRNPANYEFAIVSVAAYQTWALAGDVLYFGAGGGLGPPLYRYGKLGSKAADWDSTLEVVYGNVFLRLSPVPYVDVDVGPKVALGSALYDVDDAPQTAFSYGAYVDLRVGSERIKVGPRFEYDRIAYSNYYENGWRVTPLMLRVVH